jgi:hypothetical protein
VTCTSVRLRTGLGRGAVCARGCVGGVQVLVATGRRPYTQGLGLEALGIQKDRLGRVQVDSNFKTAVPTVYAIGTPLDCASRVELPDLCWASEWRCLERGGGGGGGRFDWNAGSVCVCGCMCVCVCV